MSQWKLLARTIPRPRFRYDRFRSEWIPAFCVLGASAAAFQSSFDESRSGRSPNNRCQAQAMISGPQESSSYAITNPNAVPQKATEEKSGGSFRLKDMYQIEQVLGEGAYGMTIATMSALSRGMRLSDWAKWERQRHRKGCLRKRQKLKE